MYNYLYNGLSAVPNKTMLAYNGTHISKNDFLSAVDSVATYLHFELKIGPEDVVTINLPNFPQALIAFYAVSKCGAIASMVHPLLPLEGLLSIMKDTRSKYIFCYDAAFGADSDKFIAEGILPILCGAEEYLPFFKKIGYRFIKRKQLRAVNRNGCLKFSDTMIAPRDFSVPRDGQAPAIYLHSGGTTGEPKTIVLSADSLNFLADKLVYVLGEYDVNRDTMLMILPMFHGFGLGVCGHFCLSHGLKVVLMPKFSAPECAKLLDSEHFNIIAGVPSLYEKLMNEEKFVKSPYFKELRCLYCGGDKLNYELKQKLDGILAAAGAPARLQEGYGMTETVTVICVNNREDNLRDCVGYPLEGIRIRIEDEKGNVLPALEKGEICVATNTAMLYYLNDPQTTAKTLKVDENGTTWVHTGDYGYMDKEGRLYFTERLKRLIKISGFNVFPAAIEKDISSLPEVKNCCLLDYKTKKGSTRLHLVLSMESDYEFNDAMRKKILDLISSKYMRHCLPDRFSMLDEFPLTEVGKVDYIKIKELSGNNSPETK